MWWRLAVVVATAAAALVVAAPASADLASLKNSCKAMDAGNGSVHLPYRFCDDGLPPKGVGGRNPNMGAAGAVAVPEHYNGYKGLPARIAAEPNTGADLAGN